MLLDEIPEGLREVNFFENSLRKNLIMPAAHGQLGKTDLGLSDMDSGHVDGSISGPDPGPTSKNNTSLAANIIFDITYRSCSIFYCIIGLFPEIPQHI